MKREVKALVYFVLSNHIRNITETIIILSNLDFYKIIIL